MQLRTVQRFYSLQRILSRINKKRQSNYTKLDFFVLYTFTLKDNEQSITAIHNTLSKAGNSYKYLAVYHSITRLTDAGYINKIKSAPYKPDKLTITFDGLQLLNELEKQLRLSRADR